MKVRRRVGQSAKPGGSDSTGRRAAPARGGAPLAVLALLACALAGVIGVPAALRSPAGPPAAAASEGAATKATEAGGLPWSPQLREGMTTAQVRRALGEPAWTVANPMGEALFYVHRLQFEDGRLKSLAPTDQAAGPGLPANAAAGATYRWIGETGQDHGRVMFCRDGTFRVDSAELMAHASTGCENRWEVTADGLELMFTCGVWRFPGPFGPAASSGRLDGRCAARNLQAMARRCRLVALNPAAHRQFLNLVQRQWQEAEDEGGYGEAPAGSGLEEPGPGTQEPSPQPVRPQPRPRRPAGQPFSPRRQRGLHSHGIHLWPYTAEAYIFLRNAGGGLIASGRLRSQRRSTVEWARFKVTAGVAGVRKAEGYFTLYNLEHMKEQSFHCTLSPAFSVKDVRWADIEWEDGD